MAYAIPKNPMLLFMVLVLIGYSGIGIIFATIVWLANTPGILASLFVLATAGGVLFPYYIPRRS